MHQPNDDQQKKEDKKLNDALKKHYFSFDIGNWGDLSDLLKEMLYGPQLDDKLYQQLNNFTDAIFATWGDIPETSTTKSIFIGKNSYGEPIYKTKHFVVNKIYIEYLNHIRSYPAYFLTQPKHYKSLFEILN